MLSIDIQNAFEHRDVDNFTCLLLRLIAKSDNTNRAKLAKSFPVEVSAVEIYQEDCPYKDEAKTEVDWEKIADRAHDY